MKGWRQYFYRPGVSKGSRQLGASVPRWASLYLNGECCPQIKYGDTGLKAEAYAYGVKFGYRPRALFRKRIAAARLYTARAFQVALRLFPLFIPSVMRHPPFFLRYSLIVMALLMTACGTTRQPLSEDGQPSAQDSAEDTDRDPMEGFNRAIFTFNDKVDRYVFKPVAKGYRAVLPAPVRKGFSNFFSNLREPIVIVNDLLQGKFLQAASDTGRFLVNTIFGIAGLFDVATGAGLDKHHEDFGQTLGVWGVGEGPFLVLPIFGPSSIRDGVGLVGDIASYPPTYKDEVSTRHKLFGAEVVDTRARLLDAGDILDQAAGDDPYIFVREAYRQRRQSQITDGAAPAPVDPSLFEDDKPAPDKSPAPSPGGS